MLRQGRQTLVSAAAAPVHDGAVERSQDAL